MGKINRLKSAMRRLALDDRAVDLVSQELNMQVVAVRERAEGVLRGLNARKALYESDEGWAYNVADLMNKFRAELISAAETISFIPDGFLSEPEIQKRISFLRKVMESSESYDYKKDTFGEEAERISNWLLYEKGVFVQKNRCLKSIAKVFGFVNWSSLCKSF